MRTGVAIAASLAVAVALPGCGGAGAGMGGGAGALEPRQAPNHGAPPAGRPAAATLARPAHGLTSGDAAVAAPPRALRSKPRRRGGRAVPTLPAVRRAASGRPADAPSTLLQAFQILRRPARSGDRPAGQARALLAADAREDRRLGEGTPVLAAARRLPAPGGLPPSWIVPAGDRACLVRSVATGRRAAETIECVRAAAAVRGYLMSAITGLPGDRGRSSLQGVLPAGAHDARLELAGGASIALSLREGAYTVSAAGARAIRFERGGHELGVRVPQVPSGAAPRL